MFHTDSNNFDVVIIGAGINGAGIARDAALRGLKVLLLDKDDIASGTSSYSTRLIHGGLRYLEHGEFGLVRESLREREVLLKIAPHLVQPLPILIPIYSGMTRGRAKIRAGMIAYDFLSRGKSLPRHGVLSVTETLRRIPSLNDNGLLGSVIYYDAQVEFAERLVLENVLSAVEKGATVITHARVEDFVTAGTRVVAARYQIQSGAAHTVNARFFVNAAGPWIDRVLGHTNRPTNERLLGSTKGSHIVVAPFAGARSLAVYVEAQTDRRPFFIIPWNGNYLIGTTDIRFEADPDEARAAAWEIDYLLKETNRLFPNANLGRSDVLYTYSGIRPLPFTTDHNEDQITRKHFVKQHPSLINLVSIVGGKLTTYRSLAEECVDLVCQKLELDCAECKTSELALPGARDFQLFAEEFDKSSELSAGAKSRLLRIYGSRAHEVIDFCRSTGLSEYLDEEQTVLTGEIAFVLEKEFAETLIDCLMRRTMIGLDADMGLLQLEASAHIAAEYRHWNEQRLQSESQKYRAFVEKRSEIGQSGTG
ncbi:MAG TPA: glycerol-3-phosphate dehydrogenase [Pyrinomonadaceae bacterium]|nr:glycerol-3-phosphate dehydrogenase [Pyrinomonadaceae bacterium]